MKMSEIREIVNQEYLKRRLDYDPETGMLTWRHDSELSNAWNGRYAGKRAGDVIYKGKGKRYACRRIALFRTKIQEHQLVWLYMTGEWPPAGMVVDHRNRDATDNRWDNLRLVAVSENSKNKSMYSRNTSGVTGVHFDKSRNAYTARVTASGVSHHLGRYDTLEEAAEVVSKFRRENGFADGAGEHPVPAGDAPVPRSSLWSDNTSGCRYIAWDSQREKWTVQGMFGKRRRMKRFDTLDDAKRYLKELLDAHPDHPYHGIPIP